MYVLAGGGLLWEAGVIAPLAVDDLVHISKDVEHATFAAPGHPLTLLCFFPYADFATNYVAGPERRIVRGDFMGPE